MVHQPDGEGGAQPPAPLGHPGRAARRRPGCWGWAIALVAIVLASCGLYAAGVPTTLTSVPDPLFEHSVSYTPDNGPPNPALLDSRPDTIVMRYLTDYLRLAGTYPCIQDLHQYIVTDDPVLNGHACPVNRPVARYAVTLVTIQPYGLFEVSYAQVQILVTYRDGTRFVSEIDLDPGSVQHVGIYFLHLDCWSSLDTLIMYPDLVPDIPIGAEYEPQEGQYRCKDHTGHVIDLGAGNGPLLVVAFRGGLSSRNLQDRQHEGVEEHLPLSRCGAPGRLGMAAPARFGVNVSYG